MNAEYVTVHLCGVCAYRLVEWEDQPSLDDIESAGDGTCGACGARGQVFEVPAYDDEGAGPHTVSQGDQ